MTNLVFHLIVNQQAGYGKGATVYQAAKAFFNERDLEFHTYFTTHPGHERLLIDSLLEQDILQDWDPTIEHFPLLVVLGGDGTLHEVVNALQERPKIPVGYLPGGSGNDFARGVGIPLKVRKSLEQLIETHEPQPINLMKAYSKESQENRLILNNIGIGLDAKIVATANKSPMKKKLNDLKIGSLSYLSAAIDSIKKQPAFPIRVVTEDVNLSFDKAYLCTTTNHPYFGGGVAIDPTASPFDEKVHLVLVEKIPGLKILYVVSRLFTGTHLTSKYVHQLTADEMNIRCLTPQQGQADGEVLGAHAFDLHVKTVKRLFWI